MNRRNHTVAVSDNSRVLKTGSCLSLSGKSKLRYEIGCGPDGQIKIRISANSAAGYFNDDWVEWGRLVALLEQHGDDPITSTTLGQLFEGRSANSGGFLLAALKNESLVQRRAQSRCYDRCDGQQFLAGITALMSAPNAAGKAAKGAKAVTGAGKPRPAKR